MRVLMVLGNELEHLVPGIVGVEAAVGGKEGLRLERIEEWREVAVPIECLTSLGQDGADGRADAGVLGVVDEFLDDAGQGDFVLLRPAHDGVIGLVNLAFRIQVGSADFADVRDGLHAFFLSGGFQPDAALDVEEGSVRNRVARAFVGFFLHGGQHGGVLCGLGTVVTALLFAAFFRFCMASAVSFRHETCWVLAGINKAAFQAGEDSGPQRAVYST